MVFGLFDTDTDGYITGTEIISTLKKYLSIIPSENEMNSMIHVVDSDRDGKISYSEFSRFYAKIMNLEMPLEILVEKQTKTPNTDTMLDSPPTPQSIPPPPLESPVNLTPATPDSLPPPPLDIPTSNTPKTPDSTTNGPRIFGELEFESVTSDDEKNDNKEMQEFEQNSDVKDETTQEELDPTEGEIKEENLEMTENLEEKESPNSEMTIFKVEEVADEEFMVENNHEIENNDIHEDDQTFTQDHLDSNHESTKDQATNENILELTTEDVGTDSNVEDSQEPTEEIEYSPNEKESFNLEKFAPVLKQIERLQGNILDGIEERRYYRGSKVHVPYAIQLFCNSFIGKEDTNYSSLVHDLLECKFGQEFTLEEFEQYKALKDGDILIGDGDCLVVANMNDHNEDFEVYLVEDEESSADGPFKISEFLKVLEITVLPEFSDDEKEPPQEEVSVTGQKLPPAPPPLYLMSSKQQASLMDQDTKSEMLAQLKLGQLHLKKGEEKEISEKVKNYEIEKKNNKSIQEQIKEKISEGNFVLKKTVVKKREKRMEREHELLFTAVMANTTFTNYDEPKEEEDDDW